MSNVIVEGWEELSDSQLKALVKKEMEELYGKNIANDIVDEQDKKRVDDEINVLLQESGFNLDLALDTFDPTFPRYEPSADAFEFYNLMRLVNGEDFEFNTPIAHYFMADLLLGHITDVRQFPYSLEVCDTLNLDILRIGFMCSRGMAKALPLDYPVMTKYGNKTIGSVKIGDTIYDGNGKLCKVTNKSEVFIDKPMYRISLLDGRTIDMSEDHINIVWKRNVKRIGTDKTKPIVCSDGGKRFKSIKLSGLKEVNITAKELFEQGVYNSRTKTSKNPKGLEYKYWIPNVGLDADYPETHFEIDPY